MALAFPISALSSSPGGMPPSLGEAADRRVVVSGERLMGIPQASSPTEGNGMSAQRSGNSAGIGLGGILVIVGIILAIVWSVWIGVIVALVGLIAFGGFARGKWY